VGGVSDDGLVPVLPNRSFEDGPPFLSLLEAIEYADTVLQIDGARAIEYREWSAKGPRKNGISDRYADAISIFGVVHHHDVGDGIRSWVRLYLSPGVVKIEWTEAQEMRINKAIRAMVHELCVLGFLIPCKAIAKGCRRRKRRKSLTG
jgi:hypothetical protein